jgi:acetyl-CoA carboxylase biotin carboxyl carrier protein
MTDKKSAVPNLPAGIDPGLVETLAEIASRLGLSEIEVAHGDLRIRVARQLAPVQVAVAAPAPALVAPPPQAVVVAPPADHPGTVKSPMVGTAYRRPSPESPPFVEIGSQVKSGDKILLIEAMKTFNDIVAPRSGTVTAILIEDSTPVEYGQPLLVIE